MFNQDNLFLREPWWQADKESRHAAIWATVTHLQENQPHYQEAFIHQLRMYSGRRAFQTFGGDFAQSIDSGELIRMNMTKSCIDTSVAQIGAERARTVHMVANGDLNKRKKAREIDQYILGVLDENQHAAICLDEFRNGGIWGSGYIKFRVEDKRIVEETVPTCEIIFDDNESRYGKPRSLHHTMDVDPFLLAELYPKKKQEIMGSALLNTENQSEQSIARQVTAVESWHLPSKEGENNGLHTIIVSGACLLEEPWDLSIFPFVKWDWQPPIFGYLGSGAVEDLQPLQVELNYVSRKVQKVMNLMATQVWLNQGTNVKKMDNQDMAVRIYSGRPPIFSPGGQVAREFFEQMDRLYGRGFELIGVSQSAAQSMKPAGVESGVAIRNVYDIGTRRFKHTRMRWGMHQVQCGEVILALSRRAQKQGVNIEVNGRDGSGLKPLKYGDIHLEQKDYGVRAAAASILPEEPAGRLEAIMELTSRFPNNQALQAAMLQEIPDVENIAGREVAAYEAAELAVQNILDTGKYSEPLPYMDLALTRDIATKTLLRATVDGVPDERLEPLRRYTAAVDELGKSLQQPPPGPMPENMQGALPGQGPSPQAVQQAGAPQMPPQGV